MVKCVRVSVSAPFNNYFEISKYWPDLLQLCRPGPSHSGQKLRLVRPAAPFKKISRRVSHPTVQLPNESTGPFARYFQKTASHNFHAYARENITCIFSHNEYTASADFLLKDKSTASLVVVLMPTVARSWPSGSSSYY